jgi:rhodanese-related sulfurtransferase
MKTITLEDIKVILDKDEDFVLLNALDKTDFDKGYIPGSINVPIDDIFEGEIKDRIRDKRKKIVVYCSGADSHIAKIAAQKLENLGFVNVFVFEGGIDDWKDAGFELEK